MIVDIWDLKKLLTKYQERARKRREERMNINDDSSFEAQVNQEILVDVLNKLSVLEKMYELQMGTPIDLGRAIEQEKQQRAEEAAAKRRAELEEAQAVAAANKKRVVGPVPSL